MCVQGLTELLRDNLTRWTELRNSCEGVHELHAIQYFIDDYRDGTLLKHKLMHLEPANLAQLMAIVDEYVVAESSMKLPVLLDMAGEPTVAKPAVAPTAGRSQPNQGKRKDARHGT
ncbi:endoglucanase 3 [Hordeum vulgare]|nr:endoglucanase 3 [Hordeum vulgare]